MISIEQKEKELFGILKQVVNETKCGTVLRVAGGWVRDKLLGRNCHDIDITVDNMTGTDFAEILQQNIGNCIKSKAKDIKNNPDKHKFLTTTTITVLGLKLELLSLRPKNMKEANGQNFGSPEDDANGRDFTINSLFYNIMEDKLEDFTGFGLEDLKKGIIRTPMNPLNTLGDDPFRSLRAIRFACQFGFHLALDLQQSIRDSSIHQALKHFISRERIYTELEKILLGPEPFRGLSLIHQLDLISIIFDSPEEPSFWTKILLKRSGQAIFLMEKMISYDIDDELSRKCLLLSIPILPLASRECQIEQILPITKYHMKDFWKWPKQEIDIVCSLLKGAVKMSHWLMGETVADRLSSGLLFMELRERWVYANQLALVYSILQNPYDTQILSKNEKMIQFWKDLEHIGENPIWNMKFFFNGKELGISVGVNPGPILAVLKEKMIRWQIEFRQSKDCYSSDNCLEYLKEESKKIEQSEPPRKKKK